MLRLSFDLDEEANAIERAVERVLDKGYRTGDIAKKGEKALKCSEMTKVVIENL